MNKALPAILLSLLSYVPAAAQYSSRVDCRNNERWRGIFVGGEVGQPFSSPFTVNTGPYASRGFSRPLIISDDGRYIWSDHPATIAFDGEGFAIDSEHSAVEVQKGGRSLTEAYLVACHKHFPPTGEMPAGDFFTKPVYDTHTEFGFTQDSGQILAYAGKLLDEGFPAGTMVLGEGWNAYPGSLAFDGEHYPDPRSTVDSLHAMGFRVMLTVTPHVAAAGRPYMDGCERKLLLADAKGEPIVVRRPSGYTACYDLAVDRVREYMEEGLARLTSLYGVDGFRFDCHETFPLALKHSIDAERFISGWSQLGRDAAMCEYLPAMSQAGPAALMSVRVGGEISPAIVNRMISCAVNSSLAGYPYVNAYIPLESEEKLPENGKLLLSLIQLACFMPVMNIPAAPWRIEDKAMYEKARDAVNMRASMGDYMAGVASASARTAEPLVRHMEYSFPGTGFHNCEDQFVLGDRYLCAPVADGSASRMVRLPKGNWRDAKGRTYKGPKVIRADAPEGEAIYFEHVEK